LLHNHQLDRDRTIGAAMHLKVIRYAREHDVPRWVRIDDRKPWVSLDEPAGIAMARKLIDAADRHEWDSLG